MHSQLRHIFIRHSTYILQNFIGVTWIHLKAELETKAFMQVVYLGTDIRDQE